MTRFSAPTSADNLARQRLAYHGYRSRCPRGQRLFKKECTDKAVELRLRGIDARRHLHARQLRGLSCERSAGMKALPQPVHDVEEVLPKIVRI